MARESTIAKLILHNCITDYQSLFFYIGYYLTACTSQITEITSPKTGVKITDTPGPKNDMDLPDIDLPEVIEEIYKITKIFSGGFDSLDVVFGDKKINQSVINLLKISS